MAAPVGALATKTPTLKGTPAPAATPAPTPAPSPTPPLTGPTAAITKNDAEFQKQMEKVKAKMLQVNKIAEQLEKEKHMIRRALLSGKFDEINREKALVYAKQWDRGIQFIPLNPSDWVGLPEDVQAEEEEEETLASKDKDSIFTKVDQSMVARRQWIRARPPSLYPESFSQYQSSTPWLPINQPNPSERRAIADWRVMPVLEDQPIYSLNL